MCLRFSALRLGLVQRCCGANCDSFLHSNFGFMPGFSRADLYACRVIQPIMLSAQTGQYFFTLLAALLSEKFCTRRLASQPAQATCHIQTAHIMVLGS